MVELVPVLTRGTIVEVNDTAVKVEIAGRLGVVTVPLRWLYSACAPQPGQKVEFYFSYMQTV
ncbi:MAG TPA: CBO2463/CBO2479 domain-containing protein [Candidatus Limiplasma sp.]|nr:CBO2463/CBO2479 domain-containing protein [Candidatus Limiplasma sp.]HPS82040.1 CBO2463/CBO2479 domain-containing protein [Candidatus Limiplasma sp.]